MSFTNLPDNAAAQIKQSIHDHWRFYLIEGVVLLILGALAIVVPPIAGISITIFVGWMLLIGGVIGLISTFGARQAPGFGWSLLSAILALIAGGVLLWNPVAGLVTLTWVLIAYFIVDGIFSIIMAIEHRRELSGRWEWMVFSGIVDLVLALVIILGLPWSLAWALGLLVGIDLIFAGSSLIAMALSARKSATGS
jgi:uncharacterized membrane protein HdeD (DUF308 family)